MGAAVRTAAYFPASCLVVSLPFAAFIALPSAHCLRRKPNLLVVHFPVTVPRNEEKLTASISSPEQLVPPSKSDQWHAVTASFLGWTLDAFDFFVVVFLVDTLAAHFRSPRMPSCGP